ncbi:MAG TPA: hemin uptake protein HemP [Planctomycetota bacterium]|nr:hemin uptake protein HemP [Planctomycetota bacterium]
MKGRREDYLSGGSGSPDGARPDPAPASPETDPPRFSTVDLFGSSSRVVIEHGGQEYVLLITRRGRLLLNRRS